MTELLPACASADPDLEPLLGMDGACLVLGCSRKVLLQEIGRGRLRYVLVGRTKKFAPAELRAYRDRQTRREGCRETSVGPPAPRRRGKKEVSIFDLQF